MLAIVGVEEVLSCVSTVGLLSDEENVDADADDSVWVRLESVVHDESVVVV